MKKGISLIVLVITIIVLAILAGAIIISLSNTNIIDQAKDATIKADLANAKYAVALEYADIMTLNNDDDTSNDVDKTAAQTRYETALGDASSKFTVTVEEGTLKPTVTAK